MAWLIQFSAIILGVVLIQFVNIVFGSGWLFIFIVEDIKQDLIEFNNIIKTTSNKNGTELTKRIVT